MSETANYCDNSTFTSYLESCLECAKTYDIWKYYGTEVKSAASNCSDDATPSPSSATTGAAATTTASGNSSSKASSSTITTTTGTVSGTAATADSTNGAISYVRQNAALPLIMGGLGLGIDGISCYFLGAFSLEDYDSSTPSTTGHSLKTFSAGAPAESVTSHSSEGEEYKQGLGSQSPLSQPPSELTSPSPTQLAEDMDDNGPAESSEIWTAFLEITSQQRGQIQRTGDRLLLDDLAAFLENYFGAWKVSGFWNGPVWNTAASSKSSPGQDRAGLMTYLLDLQNDNNAYDVKLRIARVSLFLFFEREIICERQRGIANTALKRNAVSKLCNSRGLGIAEKRKLHKSFHNEKKIGEYWWWYVSFFGPSFLLRCSKEAGKKISVTVSLSFPLQPD
ncbi:hypothetical protein N7526_008258 [Penicillium atrosanguineum]|nr:hypothetical protein N7526_008258 [Penicillium atrosanguineum]